MHVPDAGSRRAPSALSVGRGFAIVMVMYGHALAPWVILAGDRFSEEAFFQWKLGAAFLMPFFFFASGLAWREDGSMRSAVRQALALIFIAWSAASLVALSRFALSNLGAGAVYDLGDISLLRLVKDVVRMAVYGDHYLMATMWFLTAIGLVRLIAAASHRIAPWAIWAAALALFAIGLVVVANGWRNIYQVAVLGAGVAAFASGHAVRHVFSRLEAAPRTAVLVSAISAVALFATFWLNRGCPIDVAARCDLPIIPGQFSVTMSYGVYGNLPLFFVSAAAGAAFLASFAIVVAAYARGARWLVAAWGRNTVALLIVNGFYLEWVHPLVLRWIAPNVQAHGPLFFVTLFAGALALNLAAAALFHRPLRAWIASASKLSAWAVDAPGRLSSSHMRRARVSEAGE
ncbi:MAG: acyltransferase family protein [Hyphomonadaceae bacterium]